MKHLSRSASIIAFFAAVSLVIGVANAWATTAGDISGNGSGVGFEYPLNNPAPDCASPPNPPPPQQQLYGEVPGDHFELAYPASTVTGVSPVENALYNGNVDIEIDVVGHVISPIGTFASCADAEANPLLPTSVEIESVNVSGHTTGAGTGTPGKVVCTQKAGTTGSYLRVQSAVTFMFTADCSEVKGNTVPLTGSVSDATVPVSITGTMVPCNDPFSGLPNQDCDVAAPGREPGSILNTAFVASPGP